MQVEHLDPLNTFERMGVGSSGAKRTHMNMEVWLEGKRPKMRQWTHAAMVRAPLQSALQTARACVRV